MAGGSAVLGGAIPEKIREQGFDGGRSIDKKQAGRETVSPVPSLLFNVCQSSVTLCRIAATCASVA